MEKEKVILVPVNFDEQSNIALKQAYNIARLKDAKIMLLHIAKEGTDDGYKKIYEEKLSKLAEETKTASGQPVDTLLVKGKPFEEIVNAAETLEALFIVMGYKGAINVTSFLGQNPFYVIRKAPCPVITIRGKKHYDGCRRIVLPLDLTKETRQKVGRGIEFAKMFGATLFIAPVLTSNEPEEKQKLIKYSNQVISFIKEKGVNCKAEIIEGDDVSKAVIDYAKKVDADLIMIMTQQEMKLKDYVMGTKAMQVINSSNIPVLSIRPKVSDTSQFVSPF